MGGPQRRREAIRGRCVSCGDMIGDERAKEDVVDSLFLVVVVVFIMLNTMDTTGDERYGNAGIYSMS